MNKRFQSDAGINMNLQQSVLEQSNISRGSIYKSFNRTESKKILEKSETLNNVVKHFFTRKKKDKKKNKKKIDPMELLDPVKKAEEENIKTFLKRSTEC